jgi:hypothetical protein
MEYYIISLIISIVVFIFVYLYDYKKPIYDDQNNIIDNDKSLFTKNNFLLFGIIYIVTTIISFYYFTSSISLSTLCPLFILNLFKAPQQSPPLIKDNGHGDEIDPKILNKINDNIDIGFNPPNMINENENDNDNENENENDNDNDNENENENENKNKNKNKKDV